MGEKTLRFKRFFGWCPQPVSPNQKLWKYFSKPALALISGAATILVLSLLLPSLFTPSQAVAVQMLTPKATPSPTPIQPSLAPTATLTAAPTQTRNPYNAPPSSPQSNPTPTPTPQPTLIYTDNRQLPYSTQMQTYTSTSNVTGWIAKIYSSDLYVLSDDTLFNTSSVQVYVSDVKEFNITKYDTPQLTRITSVYVPSEAVVQELMRIPNSYFRVSSISPHITMHVDKAGLQEIAQMPAVYCIRIIPNPDDVLL